jgi:hypothetical protein
MLPPNPTQKNLLTNIVARSILILGQRLLLIAMRERDTQEIINASSITMVE